MADGDAWSYTACSGSRLLLSSVWPRAAETMWPCARCIMLRCAKVFSVVLLISVVTSFLLRLCFNFWAVFVNSTPSGTDLWLDENQLSDYKEVFKDKGESPRCPFCMIFWNDSCVLFSMFIYIFCELLKHHWDSRVCSKLQGWCKYYA